MGDLRFLNGLFCCSLVCLRGRLGRPETLASHGLEDVHQQLGGVIEGEGLSLGFSVQG